MAREGGRSLVRAADRSIGAVPSDAELITASRGGDASAYAELYTRHVDAARAAARALCKSRSDADDVVSEAFAKVLRVLQRGGGPDLAFRPYLLTSVRNVFYDRVRRQREEPTEDMSDVPMLSESLSTEDRDLASRAFASLPERWQQVLWHTEVEGRTATEVAPLLGLAPNAVAALAYRAREGLRQAFLQVHVREHTPEANCQQCVAGLGAYVRDGLSSREQQRVQEHLDGCAKCTALVAELRDTNTTLRVALIPAVVGVPAAMYLSGLGSIAGKGLFGWFLRMPRSGQAGTVAGAAAAAAVVVAVSVAAAGGGNDPASMEAVRPSVTVASTVTSTTPDTVADTEPPRIESTVPLTDPPPPATPPVEPPPTLATLPPFIPPATTRPRAPATTRPRPTATTRPPTTTKPPTTTGATTTTAAPTTTLAPAIFTSQFAQSATAFAGGHVEVRAVVRNTGGTTGSATVQLTLPSGVTLVGADNAQWQCAATSCTVAGVAAGADSVARLVLALDPGVPSSLDVQLAASPSSGGPVTLSISPVSVPELLHHSVGRGSVVMAGNSVLTCDATSPGCIDARQGIGTELDNNDHDMAYVNAGGFATFNGSTADLAFGGTVRAAYLVWGGDTQQGGSTAPDPDRRDEVLLFTPAGTSTVTASRVEFDNQSGGFVAVADVTSLVTGPGTYGAGDVQSAIGQGGYGGWSLIVVTDDPSQPRRMHLVTLPAERLNGPEFTQEVALDEALTDATATAGVVVFDCDRNGGGVTVDINGAAPLFDIGGTIEGTRDPSDDNTFGVDVDSAAVQVSGPTLLVTVDAVGDPFVDLGALVLSVELT
jgi:RNA polymerase sigma factor (sigma-70 family)